MKRNNNHFDDLSLDGYVQRLMQVMPGLMKASWQYDRNMFSQGEASLPQLWALEHLVDHPVCNMCELAGVLRMKCSTATGLVDRMARKGLLRRQHSRDDRRVVLVLLTARGQSLIRQIHRQKHRMLAQWFGPLRKMERQHFLMVAEKLARGLSGTNSQTPAKGRTAS